MKTELTKFALALVILIGGCAALAEDAQGGPCSVTNVSARSAALGMACEVRKAAECPKAAYPELSQCPFMQRCIKDLDQLEAECRGR